MFIGFIAGSILLIVKEEKDSFREIGKGIWFCLLGMVLVVGITWMNGKLGGGTMDVSQFSIGLGIKLFLISAIHGFLGLDFSYVPGLMFFGFGVLAGAAIVVKGIKVCLEKFRPQTVYLILGMMLGSFYAIVQGPMTLDVSKPAMNLGNFQITISLIGLLLVLGMQIAKERSKTQVSKM